MKDNTAAVIEILCGYRENKRKIEQLRYELANPPHITESELIRSLSLGGSALGVPRSSTISDKTMSVAAHYKDVSALMNIEMTGSISRELRALETEVTKLEHYVSLLDARQAQVIHLRDFEGKAWGEIELELHSVRRTLSDYRNAGIAELAVMYGFIDGIKQKTVTD